MRTGVAIQTSNYDWGNVSHGVNRRFFKRKPYLYITQLGTK